MCAKCDAETNEMREHRAKRIKASRIESALRRSRLPLAYVTGERSLEDVHDAEAVDLASATLRGELRGLYITGPAGPDKTTLAAATLARWIRDGRTDDQGEWVPRSGMFVFVPDLISDVQSTYGELATITRNDLVKPLIETPFLVLDDMGKEKASEHTAGIIMQILDGRYRLMLDDPRREPRPLLVTSNWSLAELTSRFHDTKTGEPIRRRLAEMCANLEMK